MFEEHHAAIKQMALDAYPNEGCALITKSGFKVVENIAQTPQSEFEISKQNMIAGYGDDLLAIVHSHPYGPDCPTQMDMQFQIQSAVPWVIVSTDGKACTTPFAFGDTVPTPPLIGRGFRHGVTDCYSLIRDWYKVERDILLKEFPRDWEWWLTDQELYLKGFTEAGFKRINEEEAQPGDVFLAQIRSKTPNHGGIYLGNGLILHHLTATQPVDISRVSKRDPIHRWKKFVTHWLRYEESDLAR